MPSQSSLSRSPAAQPPTPTPQPPRPQAAAVPHGSKQPCELCRPCPAPAANFSSSSSPSSVHHFTFFSFPTNFKLSKAWKAFAEEAQGDVSSIISKTLFDEILKHRDDPNCPSKGFYTYEAFIEAAQFFQGFGTTGDSDTRKREIAAFLAQSSFETTGGWATAPDGPYSWGYCYVEEQGNPPDYCVASAQWPCAPGRKYYGRGPIQISYNYNYGPAGRAIGSDLLNNPDTVTTDPVISFKTGLWFWMTPQSPKPSCHDVITGKWTPSDAESEAGMVLGYGVITNIINGGGECGKGSNQRVEDRIGFYKRYCDILGVDYGNSLDCFNQRSFADIGNVSYVENFVLECYI